MRASNSEGPKGIYRGEGVGNETMSNQLLDRAMVTHGVIGRIQRGEAPKHRKNSNGLERVPANSGPTRHLNMRLGINRMSDQFDSQQRVGESQEVCSRERVEIILYVPDDACRNMKWMTEF